MERHEDRRDDREDTGAEIDAAELRLTAYALGELDASERADVEAQLQRDPAARAEVERIRALAGELEHELAEESQASPTPGLKPTHRRAIERRLARAPRGGHRMWVMPAVAAALAVAFAVWQFGGLEEMRSEAPGNKESVASAPKDESGLTDGGIPLTVRSSGGASQPPASSDATAMSQPRSLKIEPQVFNRQALPENVEAELVDGRTGQQLLALGYLGGPSGARAAPAVRAAPARGDDSVEHRDDRHLYFPQPAPGTEGYGKIVEDGFRSPLKDPLSTFSIDVDTASYANVRRFLFKEGRLPPADAVRLEELVNYFHYDYPQPDGETPFAVSVTVTECPWAKQHRLVRIGLKGREVAVAERAPSNLVFLCDVSGSMNEPDKLPLLVTSLRLLVQRLDGRDRVALVTYAGAAGLVLDSTQCTPDGKQKVLDALENLRAGGSTAGAAGIQLAYQTAAAHLIDGGTNRVILTTDGDFNVGISDKDSLGQLITKSAKSGVFLSVLGFGTGNLQDGTAETLADKGNGNYAYIDSTAEAQKVLVQQMGGTLITIAKDVKIQVEWNPAKVASYRLLGYENRALAAQDFRNDKKDAGEIGSGHTVTALYEVVPAGLEAAPGVDPLRYQPPAPAAPAHAAAPANDSPELLYLKLRWKKPDADTSTELALPIVDDGGTLEKAGPDTGFAAAVAAFGMLLRDSEHAGDATFGTVIALAERNRGTDQDGYRAEFIRLVQVAVGLSGGELPPLSSEQLQQLRQNGYIGDK